MHIQASYFSNAVNKFANNVLKHQTFWRRKAMSLPVANIIILKKKWLNLGTSMSLMFTVYQLKT